MQRKLVFALLSREIIRPRGKYFTKLLRKNASQRGRVHGESVKGVTYENGQGASHDSPALTLEMLFVESIKNGCEHPIQRLTDCHAGQSNGGSHRQPSC